MKTPFTRLVSRECGILWYFCRKGVVCRLTVLRPPLFVVKRKKGGEGHMSGDTARTPPGRVHRLCTLTVSVFLYEYYVGTAAVALHQVIYLVFVFFCILFCFVLYLMLTRRS